MVSCLEGRIKSLEHELNAKQQIIEKILNQQVISQQVVSSMKNNESQQQRESVGIQTWSPQEKMKETEKQRKAKKKDPREQTPPTTPYNDNKSTESEGDANRKDNNKSQSQVTIIGDSMLHGVIDRGLMNRQRKVYVKVNPGANTQDIVDHLKPVVRRKPDTIIIHTGTNDITSGINTQEFLDQAIDSVKKESPKTEVVLSLPILRKDREGQHTEKLCELTVNLKRYCEHNNIKFIDNDNIKEEELGSKGLHLNKKGVTKLAHNFLNFLDGN